MSDLTRLHTMDLFSRFFQENREKFLTFAYSYPVSYTHLTLPTILLV